MNVAAPSTAPQLIEKMVPITVSYRPELVQSGDLATNIVNYAQGKLTDAIVPVMHSALDFSVHTVGQPSPYAYENPAVVDLKGWNQVDIDRGVSLIQNVDQQI